MRRNHVELAGTVASDPDRRVTPAGTPVVAFGLQVPEDPQDPTLRGARIRVVCLGARAQTPGLDRGSEVLVTGALVERRWKARGALVEGRYEIIARALEVLKEGGN